MADPLTPERLAGAPLVIVAYADGTAHLTLADHLIDTEVATWLRTLADHIEAGEHRTDCPSCAAHLPHDHTGAE